MKKDSRAGCRHCEVKWWCKKVTRPILEVQWTNSPREIEDQKRLMTTTPIYFTWISLWPDYDVLAARTCCEAIVHLFLLETPKTSHSKMRGSPRSTYTQRPLTHKPMFTDGEICRYTANIIENTPSTYLTYVYFSRRPFYLTLTRLRPTWYDVTEGWQGTQKSSHLHFIFRFAFDVHIGNWCSHWQLIFTLKQWKLVLK